MKTKAAPDSVRFEYGRHETFAVRHGWLGKGLDYLKPEAPAFTDEEAAVVDLGLGSRMVKSLRYWLEATGLAESETGAARGKPRRLVPTALGRAIHETDPYLEYPCSWWFVHLHLARRTFSVWGWLFSEFRERAFDRATAVEGYLRHTRQQASNEPSLPVAQRDVACALGAYARPVGSEPQDPEDATASPLRDLGLLLKHPDTGRFEKTRPLDGVPVEAFLASAAMAAADHGQESLSMGELLGRRRGPGTCFGLDSSAIEELCLASSRTYGAQGVRFELLGAERRLTVADADPSTWLRHHFKRIRGLA